jgi:hypothetical protein
MLRQTLRQSGFQTWQAELVSAAQRMTNPLPVITGGLDLLDSTGRPHGKRDPEFRSEQLQLIRHEAPQCLEHLHHRPRIALAVLEQRLSQLGALTVD